MWKQAIGHPGNSICLKELVNITMPSSFLELIKLLKIEQFNSRIQIKLQLLQRT